MDVRWRWRRILANNNNNNQYFFLFKSQDKGYFLRRVEARHERGIRSDIDAYTLRSQKHFQHAPVCRGLMYATLLSLIKDQKKKKELSLKPKLCYASSFYQGYRKKKSILKKCKKKGTFQDKYFMSDKNGDRSV